LKKRVPKWRRHCWHEGRYLALSRIG
jgi:hypothetical protein